MIYIDERIRKDNVERIASNMLKSLEYLREKRISRVSRTTLTDLVPRFLQDQRVSKAGGKEGLYG